MNESSLVLELLKKCRVR